MYHTKEEAAKTSLKYVREGKIPFVVYTGKQWGYITFLNDVESN